MEQLTFDYNGLDLETRIVVQQRTEEIRVLVRRSAQDIIDIGTKLIDVKARLGHGNFGRWLDAEFGWSQPTAWRFMNVADKFKSFNLNNLNVAPAALYALSESSTPEPARIEAIERASNGESITYTAAKTIVNEYRSEVVMPVVVMDEPEDVVVPSRYAYGYAACKYCWDVHNDWELGTDYDSTTWICGKCDHATSDDFMDLRDDPNFDATDDEIEATAEILNSTGLKFDGCDDRFVVVPKFVDGSSPSPMAVHYSSETPEHYTPNAIIEAVCAVMDGIDLDPCSNSDESPHVPAAKHYTAFDDGLTQYWSGRVYMNPPYGREIGAWVNKLIESYSNGDVSEWIALVPGRVDTEWWQTLTSASIFVCFVDGRLTFVGNDGPAPFPSAVVYAGENFDKFYYTFAAIGPIWKLVDPQLDFGA